jgi:hypothetical protein
MPTIHYSKKQFLKDMSDLIGDNEHILVTTEVDGTLEVLKKKKIKRIPFAFATDAFEKEKTIGDLLKSKMFAVVVTSNEIVAKKFKKDADTKKG